MKYPIVILALCVSSCVMSKPIVKKCNKSPAIVAVIDTGLEKNVFSRKAKLCDLPHKDFSEENSYAHWGKGVFVPDDTMGHGTNVAGLITRYAGDANYCLLILKFRGKSNKNSTAQEILAIKYATEIGAKYINLSTSGTFRSLSEINAIKQFIDQGGTVIAAAGNDASDLFAKPSYPAMADPRVIVVGALNKDGEIASSSNFGPRVNRWELGRHTAFGYTLSGTSMSTGVATGKIIKSKECN